MELAANIAASHPEVHVRIHEKHNSILHRCPSLVRDFAADVLSTLRVEILLNSSTKTIKRTGDDHYITEAGDGKFTTSDLAYLCTGGIPNTAFMRDYFSDAISQSGKLIVAISYFFHC